MMHFVLVINNSFIYVLVCKRPVLSARFQEMLSNFFDMIFIDLPYYEGKLYKGFQMLSSISNVGNTHTYVL